MSEKLRMDAYYYGFDATGCIEIDRILSAVASAGKAHHHTEGWTDKQYDGKTAIAGFRRLLIMPQTL